MDTDRRTTKRCTRLSDERGYSLVEMMVAIGVAVIVGLGIYAVFNYTQKSSLSQKIYNDMQTSCNFAMDQVKSELTLAGYRARDQQRPISVAAANTVTFEYYDDNARDEGAYAVGYDNNTQVTFKLVGGDLVREFKRHIPGGSYDPVNVTSQKLASNIQSLSFQYFSTDNASWSSGDVKDIRSVRASLTCNASRTDPNTNRTSQITLTADMRARNVGVASTPTDVTPPATPTGLVSWDPGQCGTLQLRWNANTEPDLEGYTIFYGLAPGAYSERLVIARAPKTTGQSEYQTITGLDSSVTGVTPQPRYYFAISAYDKSGNISPGLSTEASGNPATSPRNATEWVTYGTDTTVTTLPPAAPTGFTATAGANSVTLTWTKSPEVELRGYRLYRSDVSATFTPDGTPVTGNRIADYTTLDASEVTFKDTGLLGCSNYYYKLAAIACDTKIPIAAQQFASVTGVPTDDVVPSSPVLVARPGYKRIILDMKNPVKSGTDADFTHSKIWYNSTTYPTMDPATGVVSGGLPIPDSAPFPGPLGTFTGTGTIWPPINFNTTDSTKGSPGYTVPELIACKNQAAVDAGTAACDPVTYYFLAVSYDQCLNHSEVTQYSISEGTQCGDCNVGETCYGAPPAPSFPIQTGGCNATDGIRLAWDDYDVTTYRDLAGFHVWRCQDLTCASGGTELTQGTPTWFTDITNTATGAFPVVHGATYSYRIEAADCYYERRAGVTSTERAANNPDDNFAATSVNDLSVGNFETDAVTPQVVTGYLAASSPSLPFTESVADGLASVPPSFKHNTVTFWSKNTAAADLTLQQFNASWENPQDYLQQLAFGDGDTTLVTIGWHDTALPLTRGSTGGAVTAVPNSLFKGADTRIPVVTLFKNADGTVTRETDAREQTLDLTWTYRNESTKTDGCTMVGSKYVPLGPYVYSTTQDQPSAGTHSWPVPGDQGGNALNAVAAGSGSKITVYTNVFDSSGAGISAVRLYYFVDTARTLTAPPALAASAQYPLLPPYTRIDLEPVAGNQWRTPDSPTDLRIPEFPGSNVWFFIVAVDNQGNFDREPEIGSGAFQYYQLPANPCLTTPNPPPTLAGTTSGASVTLNWTAPTTNTSGTSYNDGKGYKVYRNSGAGWSLLANGVIEDTATLTFTDTGVSNIADSTYQYHVTAFDRCSPTPQESLPSDTYTESAEGACGNTPSPPVVSGAAAAMPDRVLLSWTAPTTNASPSVAPLTDLAGYEIWRQAGTSPWALLATVSAGALSYQDDTAINIKNVMYSYYAMAFDSCATPGRNISAPSNTYTEPIVNNPCDETPNQATLSGSTNGTSVTLTWVPPTHNTNGEIFQDGGGFQVFRSRNGGAFGLITTTDSATTTYTDASIAGDIGTAEYSYHVVVIDSCSTPNASVASGAYTEYFFSPCGTVPGAVTGLTVTKSDGTGVTLTWSAPTPDQGDFAGYEIQRKDGAGGAWGAISLSPLYGSATTVKDLVTDAGAKAYFYQVRAFDSCATTNYGGWSSAVPETFDPCATLLPNKPGTLSVTAADTSGVTLSWSPPSPLPNDIAGYEVQYKGGAVAAWTPIPESPSYGGATTIKHVIATAGANVYSYQVRAFDACTASRKYSPWEGPVAEAFTFDPCASITPPTTPVLTVSISTSPTDYCNSNTNPPVKLSWTGDAPAAGSLFYRIYKCIGSSCTWLPTPTPAQPPTPPPITPLVNNYTAGTTYTDSSLTAKPKSIQLYYQIEAVKVTAGCNDVSGSSAVVLDPCL